jgi:hypothetical protein
MLRDILRFNRAAHANLAACEGALSLRHLLEEAAMAPCSAMPT